MDTIDIIRRFPEQPEKHIIFVVYNQDMVGKTELMVANALGREYLDKYVTVTAQRTDGEPISSRDGALIYHDPKMFRYMQNGYN